MSCGGSPWVYCCGTQHSSLHCDVDTVRTVCIACCTADSCGSSHCVLFRKSGTVVLCSLLVIFLCSVLGWLGGVRVFHRKFMIWRFIIYLFIRGERGQNLLAIGTRVRGCRHFSVLSPPSLEDTTESVHPKLGPMLFE